jgi:GAF domain-containing protein
MSEQTPPMSGLHQPPEKEKIASLLSMVREKMEMDVAFVSEFTGDYLVFRALEGEAESFGWREGEGFQLDESYCKRVLDGRLPNVVPDARSEDLTKDLWVTSESNIGSYVAVPVVLSDGRPYGTLCCVSHKGYPGLRERDLGLMEGIARELSRQIKRGGLRLARALWSLRRFHHPSS